MSSMTIARAARVGGVGVETVRFYERRGLIKQPRKPINGGFREYDGEAVVRIRFIRQAQQLGFSLREIQELLNLRADPAADCAAVRARAVLKRDEVTQKIVRLRALGAALDTLIASCPGGGALNACTILDAIEQVSLARTGTKLRRPTRARGKIASRRQGDLIAMKTSTFTIKGMNCDGCARTIEAVVGRQDGVQRVEASYSAGEARILYDPKAVTEASLVAAIEKIGFRAKTRREGRS